MKLAAAPHSMQHFNKSTESTNLPDQLGKSHFTTQEELSCNNNEETVDDLNQIENWKGQAKPPKKTKISIHDTFS